MGYFQVGYDSRVINYDHRAFIRLATGLWQGLNLPCPISLGWMREIMKTVCACYFKYKVKQSSEKKSKQACTVVTCYPQNLKVPIDPVGP